MEIKEAIETLTDYCKSNVDCSDCKFAFEFNKCGLFKFHPCNWGKFDYIHLMHDSKNLTKETYISMCPLGADCLMENGRTVCRKSNGEIVNCGLDKCIIQPLACCPECGGESMEVTGDEKALYIECYNFSKYPCYFENFTYPTNSVAEICLEFDKKYLGKGHVNE